MQLCEIARIVLPTDWAMCEVLWYGMVLVAHPHGYPQAMHFFCGHRECGCQCPDSLSPLISRSFRWMTAKDLSERDVPVPTSAFVPWSQQMSAHHMKTRHAVYRSSCVVHDFSFNHAD